MYLFNGPNGLFKPTTCLNNKPYIRIDFMNPNIGFHTQHKNAFMYRNKNIQSKQTPIEPIVKEKQLSKCHMPLVEYDFQFNLEQCTSPKGCH